MFLRVSLVCLAASLMWSGSIASEVSSDRFAPRRPGEPSSKERFQQASLTYQPTYRYAPQAATARYVQTVNQAPDSWQQTQVRREQPQRFAPTRPHERQARESSKQGVSTTTVKTAYNLYKGYHSIKKATASAQAKTAEELFVVAVEDTTSPPTVAKIITYPVKLVANVVVEVVRTVAVDLWRF